MKRICAILAVLMLIFALPYTAFAEGETPAQTPTPTPTAASPSPSPPPTTTPKAEPTPEATPVVDQLHIDSTHLYNGMSMTYAQGYVPTINGGSATIILPLIGQTYDGKVTITADLGATANSPFVFGNYSQITSGSPYVFALTIPLASGRINGAYPVILNADYLDISGARVTQSFTVYVTITDGKTPIDPNAPVAPVKDKVEKPELFISSCVIEPASVTANEEFAVSVTVENIGTIRARSILLTYGGVAGGEGQSATIIPVETNNTIHLENIPSEGSGTATFKLKTTADVLSGNQPFTVTLDYGDLYGGVYTSTRQFLVKVSQPSEFTYDDIAASLPKTIEAGQTFTLPANLYNTGKSTLKNVMITVTGAGLFPKAAAFLGDIAPGGTGNGELSIFAGQLSMTEGYTQTYGKTTGTYTITYTDETGTEQTQTVEFTLEITAPVVATPDPEKTPAEQPAFQWWVTILVGLGIIAIVVAVIVVTKVTRASKMK